MVEVLVPLENQVHQDQESVPLDHNQYKVLDRQSLMAVSL